MGCPSCGSRDVQITEPGFAVSHLKCNACGHFFEKMGPMLKGALVQGVLLVLTGGLAADMSDGTFGDGWGGDGSA